MRLTSQVPTLWPIWFTQATALLAFTLYLSVTSRSQASFPTVYGVNTAHTECLRINAEEWNERLDTVEDALDKAMGEAEATFIADEELAHREADEELFEALAWAITNPIRYASELLEIAAEREAALEAASETRIEAKSKAQSTYDREETNLEAGYNADNRACNAEYNPELRYPRERGGSGGSARDTDSGSFRTAAPISTNGGIRRGVVTGGPVNDCQITEHPNGSRTIQCDA